MKSTRKPLYNIAISLATLFLVFSSSANMVHADIFSGGRPNGFITAYFSPSLTSYGYTDLYLSAMNNWGPISSQVGLTYSTNNNGTYDEYYVADTATAGLLGVHIPYKHYLWFNVGANNSDTWVYSTITVYDNQMDSYSFFNSQRISNITHELGHSLALGHPSTSQTSVMNQGQQNIGPQTYDWTELRRKWGS